MSTSYLPLLFEGNNILSENRGSALTVSYYQITSLVSNCLYLGGGGGGGGGNCYPILCVGTKMLTI